jgi:hypothetical protein
MYFFLGMISSDALSIYFQPEYQRMLSDQLGYFKSWVIVILGSLVAVLPDFFYFCIQKTFFPTPTDRLLKYLRSQDEIKVAP